MNELKGNRFNNTATHVVSGCLFSQPKSTNIEHPTYIVAISTFWIPNGGNYAFFLHTFSNDVYL